MKEIEVADGVAREGDVVYHIVLGKITLESTHRVEESEVEYIDNEGPGVRNVKLRYSNFPKTEMYMETRVFLDRRRVEMTLKLMR
jgi:hypothetical protein